MLLPEKKLSVLHALIKESTKNVFAAGELLGKDIFEGRLRRLEEREMSFVR